MLQQTRVDQARPYFERFVTSFPTVHALASAPLDEVLLNWEGLGYYSRARNLHKAAKTVVDVHEGELPADHQLLLSLPGIGPYTAAAIISIAFNQPYGVLDGNVIRVLTRLTCNDSETGKSNSKKVLQQNSNTLVAPSNPGNFNQAMMELGATVCTPKNARCVECPVHTFCCAYKTDSVSLFPVTKKKAPIPHHNLAAGIIQNDSDEILIQRRSEEKMLGGLWEFPGLKLDQNQPGEAACTAYFLEEFGIEVQIHSSLEPINHAYSHFKITVYAYAGKSTATRESKKLNSEDTRWVSIADLDNYAFHRAHRRLIELFRNRLANPSLFDRK